MGKLQGADLKTAAELGGDKTLLTGSDKIYDSTNNKTLKEALDDGDYDTDTNTDNLVDLTDTTIVTPADGEVLEYESGSWKNKAFDKSIDDLNDVDLTGITDGQILKWDSGDSKFVADNDLNSGTGGGAGRENYVINTTFDDNISDVTSNSIPLVISQETVAPLRGLGSLKVVATSPAAGDSVDIALNGFEDTDLHSILEANFDYTYNGPENAVEIILVNTVGPDKVHSSLGFLKAGTYRNFKAFYQTHPTIKTWALRIVDNVGGTDWDLLIDKPVLTPDVVSCSSSSTISARYTTDAGQAVPSGSYTKVLYPNKSFDTNGAMSNSIFTSPESRYYFLTANATWTNIDLTVGTNCNMKLVKNSATAPTDLKFSFIESNGVNSSNNNSMTISDIVYLEKDETIEVQIFQNRGTTENISSIDERTIFSIIGLGESPSNTGGEILSEIDYRGNGGQSITAAVTDISFATPFNVDKLGEWDGSGFVAKTTKTYIFSGLALFTTALNADLNSYIGGVFDRTVNTAHGIAEQGKNFICIVKLQAGERWSLRSGSSGTLSNNSNVHYINVNALAETSDGVAAEQVKTQVIANANNSQSFVNNTEIVCIFNQERVDSHGIYNDVNGQTVLEQGGNYTVKAFKQFSATTWTADDIIRMYVRVNGTEIARLDIQEIDVTKSYEVNMNGSVDYDFEKGDVVDVALFHTRTGGSITSFGQTARNHFSIRKN